MTRDMCKSLTRLLREPPGGAHLLILAASGSKFCMGRERTAAEASELTQEVGDLIALNQALIDTPLVTIARVQGDAAGFGVGLAALCDITLGVRDIRFSFPEIKMGLAPTIVLAWLQRAIGRRRAFQLTATGEEISGQTLLDLDLVNEQVDDVNGLDSAVKRHVELLSAGSPRVHAEIKAMLRDSEHMSSDQAYALSAGRLVVGSILRRS